MTTDFNDNETNSPNLEQLMQMGIRTARQGNKSSARVIFQQILDSDKQNERAWLWMAAVAETPMDRARYLNTVLRVNPNNTTAIREFEKMKEKRTTSNTKVLRYGSIGLAIILALIIITAIILTIS